MFQYLFESAITLAHRLRSKNRGGVKMPGLFLDQKFKNKYAGALSKKACRTGNFSAKINVQRRRTEFFRGTAGCGSLMATRDGKRSLTTVIFEIPSSAPLT
jgi:hypothetical protein